VAIVIGLILVAVIIYYSRLCKKKREKQPVRKAQPLSEDHELEEINVQMVKNVEAKEETTREDAVEVTEFPGYLQQMLRKGRDKKSLLALEYEELASHPQSECNVACLPHNISKNKFKNIYPYLRPLGT
jgi:hypothetical protein